MRLLLIIFILFFSQISLAQDKDFNFSKFKDFFLSKKEVIEKYGKPKEVIIKQDDLCSTYNEEKYEELHYDGVVFSGQEESEYDYRIETIKFEGKLSLQYGDYTFNSKTSIDDFIHIFGEEVKEEFEDRSDNIIRVVLLHPKADTGVCFLFKSGFLMEIRYWEPC